MALRRFNEQLGDQLKMEAKASFWPTPDQKPDWNSSHNRAPGIPNQEFSTRSSLPGDPYPEISTGGSQVLESRPENKFQKPKKDKS